MNTEPEAQRDERRPPSKWRVGGRASASPASGVRRPGARRVLVLAGLLAASACAEAPRSLTVTASAYNSVRAQTAGDPALTAWGDRLEPGMKAIAVSRDLIDEGLTHGTAVSIEGLAGPYIVRDKMAARWRQKIDIYMGKDVQAARAWGKREVRIRWPAQ